jgi:signal transduction histidine kinase
MLRLYVRFYLALLASLAFFVVCAVSVWHMSGGPMFAPRAHGHFSYAARNFHIVLPLLAIGVGLIALPLVRQITRRLERLQRGVELLGAGDLSARVKVEGNDEVARLASSFNRAASRIEQLVQANKSLLANASHELRTPLARIRLALELVKESVDPKHRAGLEQDIAELDWLVDEILLASRLDVVTDAIETQEVDLLALAAEESARYEHAHLEGVPCVIRGEPRLLRRLIRNLLENAARHGAPPTHLRIAREAAAATLTVWDHGAGVAVSEFENIFRPFYSPQDGRPRAGTGLGLSLVRQIARRHGGEARCTSMENGRSCFVVTLPAAARA